MKKIIISALIIGTVVFVSSCKKIRVCDCTTTIFEKGESYTDPSTEEVIVYSNDTTYSDSQKYPIETPMSKKNVETYCEANNDEYYEGDSYKETTTCTLEQ
ncbi:MAG: hypothetical protein ACKVJP_06100 [Flavobacteriales bacterium]|tara:strand:+ start:1867 stop:2169 length:303 start_codon:yes stop_codon:yes gene_type:complete